MCVFCFVALILSVDALLGNKEDAQAGTHSSAKLKRALVWFLQESTSDNWSDNWWKIQTWEKSTKGNNAVIFEGSSTPSGTIRDTGKQILPINSLSTYTAVDYCEWNHQENYTVIWQSLLKANHTRYVDTEEFCSFTWWWWCGKNKTKENRFNNLWESWWKIYVVHTIEIWITNTHGKLSFHSSLATKRYVKGGKVVCEYCVTEKNTPYYVILCHKDCVKMCQFNLFSLTVCAKALTLMVSRA